MRDRSVVKDKGRQGQRAAAYATAHVKSFFTVIPGRE